MTTFRTHRAPRANNVAVGVNGGEGGAQGFQPKAALALAVGRNPVVGDTLGVIATCHQLTSDRLGLRSVVYGTLRFVLGTAFLSSVAFAQRIPLGDDVAHPVPGAGHDYIHALSETVNPANGTVNINIALPVPKGRGLSLPFAVTYNSGEVHHFSSALPGCGGLDGATCSIAGVDGLTRAFGGWSDTLPYAVVPLEQVGLPPYPQLNSCTISTSYNFYDSEGVGHALGLAAISHATSNQFETPNACANATYNPTSCFSNVQNGFSGCSGGSRYTASNSGGDSQVHATSGLCTGDYQTETGDCGNDDARISFKVTDLDGTTYSFPSGQAGVIFPIVEDRNGNMLQVAGCLLCGDSSGDSPTTVVDTFGNKLINVSYTGHGSGYVTSNYAVGGLNYTPSWTTVNASFSASQLAKQVAALPGIDIRCGASFNVNDSGDTALHEMQSLSLPNGQQFTFLYDPMWGLISEVDYPSGGWVKYTWKLSDTNSEVTSFSGQAATNPSIPPYVGACNYQYQTPVVATRKVGFSKGSAAAQTQIFTYNTQWDQNDARTWDMKTTTVQTTDGVTGLTQTTTYVYYPSQQAPQPNTDGQLNPQLPVEGSVSYGDWNGTVLQTVSKGWNDPFLLNSEKIVLSSGLASQTVNNYSSGFPGVVTEKDEYDYGTTPVLSRKTLFGYYEYDLPNQIVVEDPSNHRISETDVFYDGQTAVASATTAVPLAQSVTGLPAGTHDETKYGQGSTLSRGNPTTIVRWLNTGVSIMTTHTYDETGQVLSTTDGCGNASCGDMTGGTHKTVYSYTDSPAGGNPAGNSNAYVTGITDPLGHSQSFSYNYTTGQLANATDTNGQITTYTYSDALNRLTLTSLPDGGSTKVSYNDAAPSPSVMTTTAASPSPDLVSTSTMDGMGHVVKTQINSDTTIDTVYNGMGQVQSVSNPYRSGGSTTDGTTTFVYDALGRKITQNQPDGSALQWCYDGIATAAVAKCPGNASSMTGTWVDSYDEVGNHRQQVSDALGRLAAVMEPDASNNLAAETDYGYDLLNNLKSVMQKGVSGQQSRTRSFTYDSLSRLLTSTNPETGTVCYGQKSNTGCQNGYDANGNLQYKTDARGVVTQYQYDALNRLLGKTYANAPAGSLSSCYQYDTVPNGTGRLSASWTQGGACPATLSGTGIATSRTIAGYDPVGRITQEQRCVPGRCTANIPAYNFAYGYDLAGNLKAMGDGLGQIQWSLTHDGAGHLNLITATTAGNIPNPAQLFQSTGYSPAGALQSWSWGALNANTPALLGTRTFDNRLRVSSETVVGHD